MKRELRLDGKEDEIRVPTRFVQKYTARGSGGAGRLSPLGWEHIVLTGNYDWNSGAAERTNARPLNLYPARIRA